MFLYGLTGFCFLVLFAYLFYLQVINSPVYKQRARAVASRIDTISARRGEIFDRNYDVPLVGNADSFAVDLIPGEVSQTRMAEVFQKIADLLEMDVEEVSEKIPRSSYRQFRTFEIKSGISRETIYYLAEHIQDYPGVTWHSKPKRAYSEVGSFIHALGYVDTITTQELQQLYNKGYSFSSLVGKSGIEKYYDDLLRGKDGQRIRIVDVKGQQTNEKAEREIPPEVGQNLVLTVDRHIQKLCERALGSRKGSVVVLRPETGEILALVSYPWYDPVVFTSESGLYRELALDPDSPFLNRAIQSVYPPASVFKLVLTTAAVEDEIIDPTKTIDCTGEMYYGDRLFHCWRLSGHGSVDLELGLAKSCDIYFWNLGLDLGVERINSFALEYGLNSLTEIDLPGEERGFLATPEWKEQKHHMSWLGGDTLNLSIGQGWTQVTPIQIANMVAMIVNMGVVYRPYLLGEVRDSESGDVLSSTKREILHKSNISPQTFHVVQQAMRRVVTEGTAQYVLTTKAVEAGAKTGTAEMGLEESFHSWFVAYAPWDTDDPMERIVLVVMVEAEGEDYEWWSPKAGNAIIQGIFAGQTYEEAAAELNLWYLLDNP